MLEFVRLHTAPKKYRKVYGEILTARQSYYFEKSRQRYLKTKDGQYMLNLMINMTPELGSVDSFRFITSEGASCSN